MTSMTPSCCKELAALMESDGLDLLGDMLDKDPGQFWDFFGRFADAHCQWSDLPEGELAKNQRALCDLPSGAGPAQVQTATCRAAAMFKTHHSNAAFPS